MSVPGAIQAELGQIRAIRRGGNAILLAASVNDFLPTDWLDKEDWVISADPPGQLDNVLTGFNSVGHTELVPFAVQSRSRKNFRVSKVTAPGPFVLLIQHDSVSSSSPNRIQCPGGKPLMLENGDSFEMIYVSEWNIIQVSRKAFPTVITPPTLVGTVNDFNPAGLRPADTILIDGGAADRQITGLESLGSFSTPEEFLGHKMRKAIVNVGNTNGLKIQDEDGGSSAENRFDLGGSDLTLSQGRGAIFEYAPIASRWQPLGGT